MKNNMYKIISVTPSVLWKDFDPMFKVIANVVRDDEGRLDDEYRMNAHKAFNAIIYKMNNEKDTPFVVNKSDCVINTARRSIMSNIFGVEAGSRITTNKIISVSHRLFDTILNTLPWQVADLNQANANDRIMKLQILTMKRLTSAGIDLVDSEKKTHYAFICSTPSQQKTGGMYMGNAETMRLEVVQKAMNFGHTFNEFNANVSANATEWLKANALSSTPSDPTEYNLRDVIVMKAVKIKKLLKNVAHVNDDGSITHLTEAELEQEMFDGQMLWLNSNPSGQLRGWCFKAFGIRGDLLVDLVKGWQDKIVIDIDGNERRIGDAVAICTDSCWKGSKFFKTYEEYVRTAKELAQYIPNFDKIWIVREAGEIDDITGETVDFGRRLSRQTTQQWVRASLAQLSNLTRKTRMSLNGLKTYDGLLKSATEHAKAIQDRSVVAGLIETVPELITSDPLQTWAEERYIRKQLDAAANRIHIDGNYPYICMDPVAMIQVLIEGRNPMDPTLGLLNAGEVCNRKYKDGQKLFAIRYPANYQTATVVTNRVYAAYAKLGDVAVLPYHGDLIIREDGDFDGDEMMFCPDKLVIRLTEEMIAEYKPELVDFPHGKKATMTPWGTRDARFDQIAEALWRSMKFNLVGVYSNMSVRCMHLGRINDCILMHVMAILCLDMVKGTAVPEGILETADKIRKNVSKLCDGAMPWNQIFRDKLKGITGRKYMEPSKDTVDTISKLVMSTGEYSFDAEGHELLDSWKLMQSGDRSQSTRKGVLSENLAEEFCEFYSRTDMDADNLTIYNKIRSGEKLSLSEVMQAAWINENAMQYTCPGDTINDKKAAYRELVREIAFKLGAGQDLSDEVLKEHVVNWAASVAVTGKGVQGERRGSYALFVLRVFAIDFLHNAEANLGIAGDDTFEARQAIAAEAANLDMDTVDVSIDDLDD